MYKKILSILLSFVVLFGICAMSGCGDKQQKTTDIVVFSKGEYPTLSNHAAFLSLDSNGNIRPDDALTVSELTNSLNSLKSGDGSFSSNSAETGAVSYDELKAVLCRMYDSNVVNAVFTTSGAAAVKRVDFAVGMCTLLGRTGQEKVSFETLTLPADVDFSTPNLSYLLEASVAHTVSNNGSTWNEVEMPADLDSGFQNIDGWLYYVKEDGYLLKNDSIGRLQFGADGKYTTGDKELDAVVAGVLKGIIEANPDADRMTLLRKAFIYSYEQFSYGNRYADDGNHNIYDLGHTGWEVKDAKNMFKSKQGNCYCFAAVFWALARGLGYEARAVAGTCLQDYQPHGWVIIEINGDDYIFDPEWQWAYINEHKKYDKDMFMLSLSEASWWNYRWDKTQ